MKNYPLKAAIFLTILSILSLLTAWLLISNVQKPEIEIIPLVIWIIIGILSESFTVYLEDGNIHISPIDAIFFAVYLTSGTLASLIVIPATGLLRIRKTGLQRGNLFKAPFRLTLFNICHYILILGAVHLIYTSLYRTTDLTLVPALLASPFFFLFSCILNAYFYKLEEGRSFLHYLKRIFMPHFINALAASFSVIIIALAYPQFGFVSIFFFFIPLFTTRLMYMESKRH